MLRTMLTGALLMAGALPLAGRTEPGPVAHYPFDGATANAVGAGDEGPTGEAEWFTEGLVGQALSLGAKTSAASVHLDTEGLPLDGTHAFSVQLWVRTVADADSRFVILGQKDLVDNSLASQKQAGWVFYASGGTWAWNAGSGDRRLTYERDNGEHMPLSDRRATRGGGHRPRGGVGAHPGHPAASVDEGRPAPARRAWTSDAPTWVGD